MAEAGVLPKVRIDRMVPGGLGLGRMPDGRVLLLQGGVPGDLVEFKIESDKASLVKGRVTRIVEPSADRGAPVCPHVERCGGCALLPLERSSELAAKLLIVDQALSRTGHLSQEELGIRAPMVHVDSRLAYRTRMRFQYRSGELGFFERETNSLVVVDRCAVASEELTALLQEVRLKLGALGPVLSRVEGLELCVFPENTEMPEPVANRAGIIFYERRGRDPGLSPRDVDALSELGAVRIIASGPGGEPPRTKDRALRYWILPNLYLRIEPGAFSQVNPSVNRLLVSSVLEAAREVRAASFLDLYGGAGNFTLPLLGLGLTGTLVEVNAAAVLRAEQAASEQGLAGASFRAEPVLSALQDFVRGGHRADVVILDPPRAGALDALAPAFELARSRLVLIGCDPTAFARDVRTLLDLGGVLRAVIPFDMFSGTHHVELLGIIDRPESRV